MRFRKKSCQLPCKNILRVYLCIHNARVAQLVEHDLAKVGVASSNLVSRSKGPLKKGFVVFGNFEISNHVRECRDGGIGRHARLKILWEQSRAGSIPAPGTSLAS